MKKTILFSFLFLFLLSLAFAKGYPELQTVYQQIKKLSNSNPGLIKLDEIGKSQNGKPIYVLKIGKEIKDGNFHPSIFIGANFEGYRVDGTYMVLNLAEKFLSEYKNGNLKNRIYLAPLLNPDVYGNYFSGNLKLTNDYPVDNDLDGVVDEDGPEDLNKDGYITLMRVKDEDGKWIVDKNDPRIMIKADPKKGERGEYKIYTEGIDNDGDGEINEDGKGGVLLYRNFPQKFKYFNQKTGLYPTSQIEAREFIDYLLKHRDISFVYLFGSENSIITNMPFNKENLENQKVKVPKGFAKYLGLEPNRKYKIGELVKILKESGFGRGRNITPERIAQFFGASSPENITKEDKNFYDSLKKEYENIFKKGGKREVSFPGGGSPYLWCYFQYGVYTVEDDIWSLPKYSGESKGLEILTKEKLQKMTGNDFLKISDEKINGDLKKLNAPDMVNAKMLKGMVKSGKLTPQRIIKMVEKFSEKKAKSDKSKELEYKYSEYEKYYGKDFFINWKPFNHPTLGKVEIGGLKPFVGVVPPINLVKEKVPGTFKFLKDILSKFKEVDFRKVKVKKLSHGVFKITFYVENKSEVPLFTDFSGKYGVTKPITVQLITPKSVKLISGKPLYRINQIFPNNFKKVKWIVSGKEGEKITLRFYWNRYGEVLKEILLKEEK